MVITSTGVRAPAARVIACAALVAVLAGCAANGRTAIRDGVAQTTNDANARNASAVRSDVDNLLRTLESAVRNGDLTAAQAQVIADAARAVRDQAALLEPTPTPPPTPAPTRSVPPPTTRPPTTAPPTTAPPPSPPPTTRSPSPTPTPSAPPPSSPTPTP